MAGKGNMTPANDNEESFFGPLGEYQLWEMNDAEDVL